MSLSQTGRPLKIAIFHNLPAGGAKRALREHARLLSERGHTLDAYIPTTATEDFLPLTTFCRNIYRPELALPPAPSPQNSMMLRALPRSASGKASAIISYKREWAVLKKLDRFYRALATQIDAGGYDLVYVHHCRYLLSPALLRYLKTPSVYFCQDTMRSAQEWAIETVPEYDVSKPGPTRRRWRGQIVGWPYARITQAQDEINGANLRAASLVLANSYYSREAILRSYGVSSRVCRLGVDTDFFRPDPTIKRNGVLSVGNLGKNKRHEFTLEAIAAIPAEHRPALRIVGYEVIGEGERFGADGETLGPLARGLTKMARDLGVDLSLTKEVSDESLLRAYQAAGAVAFAPHLEPFGFTSLEALATGAPLAGVAEAGLRETIIPERNGLLTERDPSEFGAALDRLLRDPELAERLSAQGRQDAVNLWSWNQSADQLEERFRSVLGARA